MFGTSAERVRRWECDTALPKPGVRPVTWQWADTAHLHNYAY